MCEFDIKLSTVEEVKTFVQVATVQPFEVYVTTPRQKVSAKSFIGMFSLDFRHCGLHPGGAGTILARCCGIFSAGSVILILTYGVTSKLVLG